MNTQEYEYLKEALLEMRDHDDYFKIDIDVLDNAVRIMNDICGLPFPYPKIFSHGEKSVVFVWDIEKSSLYMTVSKNNVALLRSDASGIIERKNYGLFSG